MLGTERNVPKLGLDADAVRLEEFGRYSGTLASEEGAHRLKFLNSYGQEQGGTSLTAPWEHGEEG